MNTFNKLLKAKSKYDSAIGDMEKELSEFISFEFGIEYQPSDGFVLLNIESCNVAPLSFCIQEIKKNGIITESIHKSLCI